MLSQPYSLALLRTGAFVCGPWTCRAGEQRQPPGARVCLDDVASTYQVAQLPTDRPVCLLSGLLARPAGWHEATKTFTEFAIDQADFRIVSRQIAASHRHDLPSAVLDIAEPTNPDCAHVALTDDERPMLKRSDQLKVGLVRETLVLCVCDFATLQGSAQHAP